jgi:hypothetical protein
MTNGAGSAIGLLLQINDMLTADNRAMVFSGTSTGEAKSWMAEELDFIVLSATEVTGVVPVAAVEEVPAAADAPAAATPAPAAVAPAAKTGDAGIIVLAAVMMIAAAGIVVFRKQTAK